MGLHPAEALPTLDWTGWDTRYLFFTGVQQVWTSSESTKEAAEKSSCAALKREPVIHRRHKPSDF